MSAMAVRPAVSGAGARSYPARLDALVIVAPGLLALALCLLQIGARSLWLDEAASVSIASQHGAAFGAALARDGGNMLGYYALLHLLIGAFGHGAVVIRLPSALAAAATVALVAALGLRLWGRREALVAGSLAAVSLPLVYWGQDARGYAVMVALCAGSWLVLLTLSRDGGRHGGRLGGWRSWLLYVLVTTAAVYAGLEAALIVPAQLLVVMWRRRSLARAGSAVVAVALLCAPLAVLAAGRGSGQLFWVPAPSWRTAKQVAQALSSSGLQPGYYTPSGDALMILTGVVLAMGVAGAIRRRGRIEGGGTAVLAWLAVPLALELVLSLAGHSIFQARYALVSLPAVALALAWALRASRLPGWVAVALLAALVALRAVALAPSYGVSTEQWREATAYVAQHTRSGDCIAFYPQDARAPFEYYAGQTGRLPTSVLPAVAWGEPRSYVERYDGLAPAQLQSVSGRCSRMWLVWSHEGRVGGPPVSGANARRLRSLRAQLARSYPRSQARRFGRASPISVALLTAGR